MLSAKLLRGFKDCRRNFKNLTGENNIFNTFFAQRYILNK